MKTEYVLKGDYIELIKLLKTLNLVGSGGEAKMVVEENMVYVNSKIELRKRRKLIPGDVIEFEGRIVVIK